MREDSSPPYSQAPTDFRAAVTTDENPGPQEESLLLLIPPSLSMNTQQHPRSRSSYSGGRPNRRATSGAGSRCSESAGPSAPRSLALSQPSEDPKPALRSGSRRCPNPRRGPASPGAGRWRPRGARETPAQPHHGGRPRGTVPGSPPRGPRPEARLTLGTPGRSPRPPSAPARRLPQHPRLEGPSPGPPARRFCPGRWWAAGSAPPVRQARGGEPERSRGPAAWGARGASPATYARALGKPMESSTSSADPCLMVPGRCWRLLRGVTLLYSSSLAAMPSGPGWPY